MTQPREIRVTIDRLVLHGVPPGQAAAVERALAAELQARLQGAALPAEGVAASNLRLDIGGSPDPGRLGRDAGAAVAGALLRSGR